MPQTENAESIHADLEAHAAVATRSSPRLCVHAHCFYPELIKELIPGFHNLPPSAAIVITTVRAADAQFIRHALSRHRIGQSVEVRVVPNRGRDIAPFLVGCQDIWRDFDIVLHLHTKVSSHVYWGAEWRNYLFDQTLSSKKLVDWVLGTFSDNPTLGCLYPRNFYRIREFVNAEQNSHLIGAFMEVLGFSAGSATQPDYPAGSMAWYRTDALTRLVDALPNLDRFEDEEDQVDLTFAHALERILTLVVRASGYVVYHSHAFDMRQHYSVATTEGRFWAERFGINLHPDADAAIKAMNERDRAFALRTGIPERVLQQRYLQNRATVQGRSVGYDMARGLTPSAAVPAAR